MRARPAEAAGHTPVGCHEGQELASVVAFDVDGRRQAMGTARIEGIEVGSAAPVEISVPASFPESLPTVRCRAEVRHAPAS